MDLLAKPFNQRDDSCGLFTRSGVVGRAAIWRTGLVSAHIVELSQFGPRLLGAQSLHVCARWRQLPHLLHRVGRWATWKGCLKAWQQYLVFLKQNVSREGQCLHTWVGPAWAIQKLQWTADDH